MLSFQINFHEDPGYDRLILMSDLHGHYHQFQQLLQSLNYQEHDLSTLLVCLGDMIDRGPHSIEVLNWFYERKDVANIKVTLGNHEEMLSYHVSGKHIFSDNALNHNGMLQTVFTFKNLPKEDQDKYLGYIDSLPYFLPLSNVLLSHSCFDYTQNNMSERFLWSRDGIHMAQTRDMKDMYFIFGHTPVCYLHEDKSNYDVWVDPLFGNKICIDFAAAKRVQVGALVLTRTSSPLVYDATAITQKIGW